MKNKKYVWIFLTIALLLFTTAFFIVRSWTMTKYGKLHVRSAVILKIHKYLNPSSTKGKPINEMRKILDRNQVEWSSKNKPDSLLNIKNMNVSEAQTKVPIRVYTPKGGNKLPIIIYMHGGSWIGGSLDTHDNICRKLSKNTKAIVISVGYRLAPENPFPAGLYDIYNVIQWTYKNAESINGNPNLIAVAGDSAGGNLAAAVCEMIRDKNGPHITCQVLVYPSTNIFELNSKSWSYFANDYDLNREDMERYISLYVPKKEDRKSPYASPLLADGFKGLPPALIITAEFDPLRDEGEAYAKKLESAGVEAVSTRYKGVTHGFISMNQVLPEANEALDQISLYIQKKFQ